MVYVREDSNEKVTDSYKKTNNGVKGVMVETEEGYFKYWFPIVEPSEKYSIDSEKVLDVLSSEANFRLIEAEGEENESVYNGHDNVTIPQKVVDRAKEVSGYPLLE
jgi:energy-converting hydrogenase A subunit M